MTECNQEMVWVKIPKSLAEQLAIYGAVMAKEADLSVRGISQRKSAKQRRAANKARKERVGAKVSNFFRQAAAIARSIRRSRDAKPEDQVAKSKEMPLGLVREINALWKQHFKAHLRERECRPIINASLAGLSQSVVAELAGTSQRAVSEILMEHGATKPVSKRSEQMHSQVQFGLSRGQQPKVIAIKCGYSTGTVERVSAFQSDKWHALRTKARNELICSLKGSDVSQREVAELLSVSQATVSRLWRGGKEITNA